MASYDLKPRPFTPPSKGQPTRIRFTAPTTAKHGGSSSSRSSRCSNNPIHPATSLQVSYRVGEQEVFSEVLTPEDVHCEDEATNTYAVMSGVAPQVLVPVWDVEDGGQDGEAMNVVSGEVVLHAWRNQKLLEVWTVGRLEGMGTVVGRRQ